MVLLDSKELIRYLSCIHMKYIHPRMQLLIIVFAVLALGKISFADDIEQEQDEKTASLFGDTIIPSTSFGRQTRPVNLVAENVTVITRADIDRLQAHSLGDVLQFYPGVLASPFRYSNDLSIPMIQGLPNRQTLVTFDGIPLNNASDGIMDAGTVPVRSLERIEIVKGPAASVWGRSVGAVINLVTKEPDRNRILSGQITGTLGTNQSGYGDVTFSGYFPKTGTGYYVGTSVNQTNGFQEGIGGDGKAVYVKLTQDIGSKTDITALFARSSVYRDFLHQPSLNIRGSNEPVSYFGIGRMNHQFSPGSNLEANLYLNNLKVTTNIYNLYPVPQVLPVSGILLQSQSIREETTGIQLAYKRSATNYWLTLGVDASSGSLRNSDTSYGPAQSIIRADKNATNVAEYLSVGCNISSKLTLTGSYRYDWYNYLDDTHSTNLGLIYRLTEKTLFRITYGNGVSLPTLSSGSDKFETLWRTQIGVETNDIPFLWAKLNGFYDRTNNVKLQLQFFDNTPEKNHSLTREGFEVEVKTTPILNTSLGLGYTYTHIFNTESGMDIQGLPRHHLIMSANYRAHGTDASLYARYINWNSPSATDQVVWDFLLSQRMLSWETGNANLNFSFLNITNASQQSTQTFTNPPLRAIAGFSVNF